MNRHKFWQAPLIIFLFALVFQTVLFSQRVGFSKDEMTRRREALMERLDEGLIVLFGECMPTPGGHFRQDNDFYYFTGIEDTGAIVIMTPKTNESFLFLPRQTSREMMVEGENLLKDEDAKEKTGFTEIYPVTYFDEFLARSARRYGLIFHVRLSPRDSVDNARWESMIFEGRKNRIHYNDQISLDNYRINKLKERYPVLALNDITPLIDEMRVIKSAEEMEVLRRNGKISAEGVKQAILATRPGVFEYQIEAAAMHVILNGGAKGAAYPPIVGSGPNSCIWHYDKNARKVEEGDLVLMDFGADLDYLCMDITRTWPVSGKFAPEQREVYEIVLAVQKACIEAYRPGVTSADVRKHVAEVMKKKGLDPKGLRGGIGHYVGMCVHDVGPRGVPLQEGMVFAIEPALYYPEKNFGIRIEDTVLITKDGCEVLTKDVPKELEEIESLMLRKE
ncbi:MAG: aminopeptidase P family protein [Candidatus Aminicenantes bacterium]|nr:MAG: aminopeptidase P family protein [Candidatus Aminicenantes bacterium]